MKNRWSDAEAAEYQAKYEGAWGEDLASRTYVNRLIGNEPSLVLHGRGKTSVKTSWTDILGQRRPVIYVNASGSNLASIGPEGYIRLDLEYLAKLRALPDLSDQEMVHELRTHTLDGHRAHPPIETLLHVFIPKKFIDQTQADAILALANQPAARELIRDALGQGVLILECIESGARLALAAAIAYEANPHARAMVLLRHGLVSWGDTARDSYETTINLVTCAEDYLARNARHPLKTKAATALSTAEKRLTSVAPVVRGMLANATGDPDWPYHRTILLPLITREVLDFTDSDRGKDLALTPPLSSDHVIHTKALPLWIDDPQYDNLGELRNQIARGLQEYCAAYDAYFERHSAQLPAGMVRSDSLPRVILLPGLGALCSGGDAVAAGIVRDITARTLAVKTQIAAMGSYLGMSESDIFDIECRSCQQVRSGTNDQARLSRHVVMITGAAGAIGSGIAQELLEQGCHVALTDLPGENLHSLSDELSSVHPSKVLAVPLDVTDAASVTEGFGAVIRSWGGVDLVVINAGAAHVSPLAEMDLERFRRLERINVEGTLLVLSEAARHFKHQNTGGDIVLISTKNVFAPGPKFGAYSATKSAAHQLARIASLEFAELGVRVNMVAPDAVFSSEMRKSGLWAEVGPERMSARGLDARGLEEYYRTRNLLKARITARHVAKAVLFFATRQTPTTGITLPVDGGLPDATPR